MKILNVVSSIKLEQGGPPEVVRNYSSVINKKEKRILLFKLKTLSVFYLFSVIILNSRRKKFIRFIQKFDIIHYHDLWNIKILIINHFAKLLGKKTILIPHGVLDSWSLKEKYLKKKIYSSLFLKKFVLSLDAIFFSTKDEYFEAKKNFKLPFAVVIPNGINLSKFKKISLNKNIFKKKKIIFFGRIHKKKGIELLLDTIKSLPESFFKEFYFEITGPGELKYINIIVKLIKSYKLSEKVFVEKPKKINEKIEYLKTGSVFILPSFEEADSIALKEAMSLSLPVIISEQCRMNIVAEKHAGFVIKTNISSIKDKLLSLKDLDLNKMGENSRKIIEDYYDNQYCVSKLWHVYEDLYTGSHSSKAWINLNE